MNEEMDASKWFEVFKTVAQKLPLNGNSTYVRTIAKSRGNRKGCEIYFPVNERENEELLVRMRDYYQNLLDLQPVDMIPTFPNGGDSVA